MTSQPRVSVTIPALNEEASISGCLDSVLSQTWAELEVLVLDGGSTDRTVRIVEAYVAADPRVRLVSNPKRTQAAAMNTALGLIETDFLIRIDAHSTVGPTYVAQAMAHLADGGWAAVGGRKDGVGFTEQGRAIAAALGSSFGVGNSTYHHGVSTQTVDHIPFGAYNVAIAREVGGWDESIGANEDYEFDYRLRQAGHELLFDPEMVIFWQTRQELRGFMAQYRRYGRGKVQVLRKHPESAAVRHLVAPAVVGVLGLAALTSFRKPLWGLAAAAPYPALLAVASAATAPKVPDQASRRWLPAAFAAMHLGWGLGFWEALILGRKPS